MVRLKIQNKFTLKPITFHKKQKKIPRLNKNIKTLTTKIENKIKKRNKQLQIQIKSWENISVAHQHYDKNDDNKSKNNDNNKM